MKTYWLQQKRHYRFVVALFWIVSYSTVTTVGLSAVAEAATSHPLYSAACGRLLGLIEGSFGALITVAAGIGAIISSSVGGFRTAWTLLVVAVGAFILRAYVTLFFAPCLAPCLECVSLNWNFKAVV